jgi:hypothetical protein
LNGVQRLNLNAATYKTLIVVGFVVGFVVVAMTSSAQLMDDQWLEEVGEVRLPVRNQASHTRREIIAMKVNAIHAHAPVRMDYAVDLLGTELACREPKTNQSNRSK